LLGCVLGLLQLKHEAVELLLQLFVGIIDAPERTKEKQKKQSNNNISKQTGMAGSRVQPI
jgi:hypothetical protein